MAHDIGMARPVEPDKTFETNNLLSQSIAAPGASRARSEPGLSCLVRSTAHATGCPIAVFYALEQSGPEIVTSFGDAKPTAEDADWVLAEACRRTENDVFILNDVQHGNATDQDDTHLFGSPSAPVRFIAAVRVPAGEASAAGLLVVADRSPHAGLSAAMIYVLRTHAAQLALAQGPQTPRHVSDDISVSERLRLLEAVVVNANDAVLITQARPVDLPGPQIVYCNAAFTRMTGYQRTEVIGQTPRILQGVSTDRKSLDRLRDALAHWKPIELELCNRRKNGTEFWVELSIVPVADETGWYTHWISVQRDVTARKAAEAKLHFAAFHDDLTKLRNRAFFMDRLGMALDLLRSNRISHCSILFMDLDGFKLVNDSLGHEAGDQLLMEVAQRLRQCVRPTDTLARLGGDEFALIIEGDGEQPSAAALAQRIIDRVRHPIWLGKQEVFCTCSIGISIASEGYASPEDMLRDADVAMYKAKKAEPGSIAAFGPAMRDNAVAALELKTDLRNAISRDELFLQYQPICDPTTRRVNGIEALLRWHHPQRGTVYPGEFIPTAEESDLIRDIGRWVLQEACIATQLWRERFPTLNLWISVNVSGKELRSRDFVAQTKAALMESGLEPAALQLEITESVFLHQPEVVGNVLDALRATRIQVALDDFGTGYSSLGFIDRYPMDAIKIDRSFVGRMLKQQRTVEIVRSIAQLGHNLGLKIVAEGVENEDQLSALQASGCDFVQGYLLGRPLLAKDMESLLQSQAATCKQSALPWTPLTTAHVPARTSP